MVEYVKYFLAKIHKFIQYLLQYPVSSMRFGLCKSCLQRLPFIYDQVQDRFTGTGKNEILNKILVVFFPFREKLENF